MYNVYEKSKIVCIQMKYLLIRNQDISLRAIYVYQTRAIIHSTLNSLSDSHVK